MAYAPLVSLLLSCALLVVSSSAYAVTGVEETIAAEAFNTVVGGALTTQMQNNNVVYDLAGRYYEADSTLQDDSPIVNSINGKTLHDYTYEQWMTVSTAQGVLDWYMVHPETGEKIPASSPLFQSVYEDWYNYYAGITEGGGNTGDSSTVQDSYTMVGAWGTWNYQDSTSSPVVGQSYTVSIDSTVKTTMQSFLNTYPYMKIICYTRATSYGSNTVTNIALFSSSPINVNYSNERTYAPTSQFPRTVRDVTFTSDSTILRRSLTTSLNVQMPYPPSNYTVTAIRNTTFETTQVQGLYINGTVSQPQPTEPTYPTPYEPYTPTQPTSPTNNNPTNVTIGGNTYNNNTSTTTADLTPLLEMLRVINSNIIEFETGFNNYANKVQEYLSNIYDMVYGFLENIQNEIDDYGRLILEELREANQWLAYIFYSLGQSGGSQPDPVVKPDDWWGWLGNLADGLLGDLPSELTALTGTMQALRSVFPFSLPWDLGVLLGLFVATPVTPVIDIPFGYSANGFTYVRVDCSSWNNVMATVRSVEIVAFAAGLAFKTRDLLKVVEV